MTYEGWALLLLAVEGLVIVEEGIVIPEFAGYTWTRKFEGSNGIFVSNSIKSSSMELKF